MGGDWHEVALGDLFKVKHGFAFKGEFFTDEPQPEVMVTPGNFAIGGGFQDDKRKYYRGPVPTDYVLRPGQIVVTMTDLSKQSDTLGFAARVPSDTNVWLHNQRVGLLVFNPSAEADARFVEYLLRSHEYRAWVVGSATGTTVKHTSPSRIEGFRTRVPPPDQQRAIAHILGTLDDKIELNRRRNQTLETMARALFKDWFIDFGPVRRNAAKAQNQPSPGLRPPSPRGRGLEKTAHEPFPSPPGRGAGGEGVIEGQTFDHLFPDRLDDEGKPEGWKMRPLSELLTIIGGGTPKTSVEKYWDGDIPWFSVVDTPSASDVFVVATEKTITAQGLAGSSARLIPKGTTIISARGTVGNLAIAGRDMTFNQSCYGLRGTDGAGDYFVYLTAQQMVDQLKSMAHGSVFSTITRQTFEAIQRPVPPSGVLTAFEGLVRGWFDAVLSNVEEARTLAQLRDTLLPKLMSGQVRVDTLLNEGVQ